MDLQLAKCKHPYFQKLKHRQYLDLAKGHSRKPIKEKIKKKVVKRTDL